MNNWWIFLTLLGFLGLLLSDWYQGLKKRAGTLIFRIIGYFCAFLGTLGYVLYGLRGYNMFSPKNWVLIAGLVICTWLLFKSLVIDVQDNNDEESSLFPSKATKKGTYAISRHPGFLWYCCLFAIIDIYVGNLEYILGSLILIFGNFILILVEDLLLFPRIFDNYNIYKKEVPFFLSLKWLKIIK